MARKTKPPTEMPMTLAALKTYVDDTLARAHAGEVDYVGVTSYLVPLVDEDSLDSKLTCLLYFVANYTMARHDRDNTEAECAGMNTHTDEDARQLAEYVRAHEHREAAFARHWQSVERSLALFGAGPK